MKDALTALVQTYLGLALLWPVATATVARIVNRRYDAVVAADIRRIAGPALALLFLGVPVFLEFPFAGVIVLGIWIAYADHVVRPEPESGEGEGTVRSLHQRLRALLGTDDGPFRK